jgi:hypothetical protein
MATVYIWKHPYMKSSAGHASMVVDGGQPPGTIYISWWPEKRGIKSITIGVRRAVHARLGQDEVSTAEGRAPDSTLRLQGPDETRIKAFWTHWLQNEKRWGLSSECATTVGQALKEGGGEPASRVSPWRVTIPCAERRRRPLTPAPEVPILPF